VNNKVETAQLPSADGTGDESIESQIDSMRAYMRQLETSVEIKGNSVMVPVKVTVGRRNTTLSLILDTGATSTIIHDDALRGLGVGTSKGGRAQVAGGAMIETRKVTLDRFEVGPYKLQSVSASVIEHEQPGRYDGLLGMDFLRSVKYDIDFERAVVIWERDKYDTARRNLEKLQARLEESQTTSVAKQDEPTQP
jgi:clan AA aspartic protease (TIGR02281 family)